MKIDKHQVTLKLKLSTGKYMFEHKKIGDGMERNSFFKMVLRLTLSPAWLALHSKKSFKVLLNAALGGLRKFN
ncbi:hypothetical protein [Pseudoalteromonas luteoviolacea]|uniref:hypothetical protein n=1 Tax=Pseudoalteromonas luteoviolacea TaxID=43657 RepID=UPI001B358F7B|nr:hypothetical protein [Pseudoalteromonas luteoviolacea]MBQ4838709.1 hypothetical protein [Pseudoalteromonas luteoviolacea]